MKKYLFLIAFILFLSGCGRDKQETVGNVKCLEWYNRGLENMANPEDEFKNAIKADWTFPPSYYWLAYYYCRVKRTKESIEYFEKYLQTVLEDYPQEISRRKTAKHFIREMKAGNTDYDSIVEKSLRGE
ncbi:MAG: hypothetical protein PHG63_03760 [Candidatus Dojkabacteria bacterium]|nr:hypothetical protein [Candidatus Dojkabacteria bacterium]